MKLTEEQVDALLKDAAPQVTSALISELKTCLDWNLKETAAELVRDHTTAWINENVLPEITAALVESKDGLVSLGLKVAEGAVQVTADALVQAIRKNLENNWDRKKIVEALFC